MLGGDRRKGGIKTRDTKPWREKNRLKSLVPSLHGKYMGKKWKLTDLTFLGSKIPADGDCSHEIKDDFSLEEKL